MKLYEFFVIFVWSMPKLQEKMWRENPNVIPYQIQMFWSSDVRFPAIKITDIFKSYKMCMLWFFWFLFVSITFLIEKIIEITILKVRIEK